MVGVGACLGLDDWLGVGVGVGRTGIGPEVLRIVAARMSALGACFLLRTEVMDSWSWTARWTRENERRARR